MSQKKKEIRSKFRDAVFARDRHRCRMCDETAYNRPDGTYSLDAHHIVDRNEIPNGGYVKENGISLCPNCHSLAEEFHKTGVPYPGYSPDELYAKIGSSLELAVSASLRLKV